MESAAFLSDRPERFKFKYQETDPLARLLRRTLREQALTLYSQGVKRICCGPSPGVGFWAAETILELSAECPDFLLTCVLPFEGCDRNWDAASRRRYRRILSSCKEILSASRITPNAQNPTAVATAYKRRNYLLVDQAAWLVVVYDQDRSVRTQVGQAVNYAKSKGRSIVYIHPDTAEVTG